MSRPFPLDFPPGVQRDGTRVDSNCSVDALWTRWRLGRPRKMGGYKAATNQVGGIGRRIHLFYSGSRIIAHIGHSKGLDQVVLDSNGNFISRADRTPLSFTGGIEPSWTLDALFDTVSDAVQLIAHSTNNIAVVADNVKTPPFAGLIDDTARLAAWPTPSQQFGGVYTPPSLAGGVVSIQPYAFSFDSDGTIAWSAPNNIGTLGLTGGTSGAGRARVSAQKFVAGMPLRGGGANSPAAIFWSLSEVVTASFVGQASGFFAFNTASPSSSILSGATAIEHDGLYYWAGVDRFLMFNGTVVEVPNAFNLDWFFDGMNWAYAGKSFAFKVPRFGEIWFCAPLFGAMEPSHAAIYNVRDKCWYDTVLPDGGRSAGHFAQGFRYPIMSGTDEGESGYQLWLHEYGKNRIDHTGATPVRAYVSTPFIGGPRVNPPDSHAIASQQLEADIRQTGDMAIIASGGFNPRSADLPAEAAILEANPATAAKQLVGVPATRRLLRLIFESHTMNGDYIMGRSLLHVEAGDQKMTGGVGEPLTAPPPNTANNPDAPLTIPSTPLSDFTDE